MINSPVIVTIITSRTIPSHKRRVRSSSGAIVKGVFKDMDIWVSEEILLKHHWCFLGLQRLDEN